MKLKRYCKPASLQEAVQILRETEGPVTLLAGGTDGAVEHGFSAGAIIKDIAGLVGGRGGGKPAMAQAGGSDASGIDAALDAARAALGI